MEPTETHAARARHAALGERELAALLRAHAERPLRTAPGRETFVACDAGGRPIVVKRYSGRAALVGRLGAPPGRREHEALLALAGLGLRVPAALGWTVGGGRSLVAMEHVAHETTLRELAAEAGSSERRARLERLARDVARLHAAGWYHRDLYLEHWLVDGAGEPVLIDLGRARRRRRPRRRWLVKDLAALLHSTPAAVGPRERLRFLALYLGLRGIDGRARRRSWARAVAAKARRMAAHRPRHGRSFDRRAALEGLEDSGGAPREG